MHRIRFEPIDVNNNDDFIELYTKLRKSINRIYKGEHDEILPAIRKVYPIDDNGFPLNLNE